MPRVVKFIETESSGGCQGLRGEGYEKLFNGCRGPVWEHKKALKVGGGDGSTIMRMYLTLLNCILKNG